MFQRKSGERALFLVVQVRKLRGRIKIWGKIQKKSFICVLLSLKDRVLLRVRLRDSFMLARSS
jgi:hypothetical protein